MLYFYDSSLKHFESILSRIMSWPESETLISNQGNEFDLEASKKKFQNPDYVTKLVQRRNKFWWDMRCPELL